MLHMIIVCAMETTMLFDNNAAQIYKLIPI